MSWYDNIFLAPPEYPEPQLKIGTYEIYHNDVEYEVVVDLLESDAYFKDTYIESVYRWEEDGITKIECSNELNDADYDAITNKILEMNKNDRHND